MRLSVIAWSALSGLILAIFVDALLIGVWVVASTFVPALSARGTPRWVLTAGVAILVAIAVAGAIVGYLEGKLKAG